MTAVDAKGTLASRRVTETAVIARTLAYTISAGVACLWTADPDLWGHLRFGLDAIRDRGLTSTDPYSFTSDVPWINHEWLSEAALAAAYLAGGVSGMLALKVALVGSTFALLAWHARHAPAPARWWVLAAAGVLIAPVALTHRPQLWTGLFLAVITTTTDWNARRIALLWPLIFMLWANLHGGWVVGLGIVGAWIVGKAIDAGDWRCFSSLAVVGVLCAAATLITPYSFELWGFIYETVGVNRRDIDEWQPIWAAGGLLWIGSLLLVTILVRRAEWTWATVLPVALLAIGSIRVGRLGSLWVIVAVGLLLPRWRGADRTGRFDPALLGLIGVIAIVPSAFLAVNESRCLRSYAWDTPDIEAAGSFRAASGRLMVPFNWGQYALWHFAPQLKVSFDGRRETVYSPQRIIEQHALASGDLSIVPFIQQERPEYVWVPRPKAESLSDHLQSIGYRVDVTTDRSIVLTRADLPILVAAGMSACFP